MDRLISLLSKSQEDNVQSNSTVEKNVYNEEGHDTTAAAVSFALYLFSEHLDVQEKAVDEIKSTLSDSNFEFTSENLYNLKYLEAVIKETLRLYPSVAIIARHLHEDCKYRNVVLPEGIDIFIFTYALQRNPKYYEHPDDFIPERYLSENKANRSTYSYIPFGGGSRNCIGQKFAMLEMKCMLVSILLNYKILPTLPRHKLDIANEVVLKSYNGVCVQLEERR